jgi:photosystem II stability/assembly factor-like uncharacterized protein
VSASRFSACLALVLSTLVLGFVSATPASTRPIVAAEPYPLFWIAPKLQTRSLPPRISAVAFDPATPGVAIASSGNSGDVLLRTTDHGLTWSPLGSWAPARDWNYRVTYGEQKGTYYAWGATSVYKTTNSGDSWQVVPYFTLCNQITSFAVSPTHPSMLYVGTSNGFARSEDGGTTWDSPLPHPCGGGPHAHTISTGVDKPGVVYAGEFDNYGGGVYRSADRGVTWERVNTGLPIVSEDIPGNVHFASVIQVAVDPRNADVVYALTEAGKVYRTTNGGARWEVFDQGLEALRVSTLKLDTVHDYRLVASTEYQVYVREAGAPAWEMLPTEPIPQVSSFAHVNELVVDAHDVARIIALNNNGLYVSLERRGSVLLPLVAGR